MLFLPAPAELLSWNQKPWLSRHAHAFGSVQQVRTRLSERVSQEHLQLQLQCPAFTCCERLSKLPTGCFLQDRSSCQFEELFRKHKLVFTGPVWIAGHVAPLNRCRIASSSRLQMAMITKPTSLPPQNLQTMVPNHPKPSGELGWLQCPWLSTVFVSCKIYPL